MGLPAWMRRSEFWAQPADPLGNERANFTVVVP
jgi:hypothetical protein